MQCYSADRLAPVAVELRLHRVEHLGEEAGEEGVDCGDEKSDDDYRDDYRADGVGGKIALYVLHSSLHEDEEHECLFLECVKELFHFGFSFLLLK